MSWFPQLICYFCQSLFPDPAFYSPNSAFEDKMAAAVTDQIVDVMIGDC
jgi:hypothetical protein